MTNYLVPWALVEPSSLENFQKNEQEKGYLKKNLTFVFPSCYLYNPSCFARLPTSGGLFPVFLTLYHPNPMRQTLLTIVLLLIVGVTYAQDQTVSGTVTAADDGSALPGVNVLVQGTTIGTITDVEGAYRLTVPEDATTLTFSFVGYEGQTVDIDGRSQINLQLDSDINQLEDVVVTALGITKEKRTLTYSTQDVASQGLEEARTLNITEGLSGKVAGIAITTTGAGVGAPTKVVLRGNRSLQPNGSQPLYVVDGIPMGGDISNISPSDIADISILKGGNAAALYGSRANNGAIVITTKSGADAPEGISADLRFNYQANTPILLTEYQNEYGQGSAGRYAEGSTTSWGPRMTGQTVPHWSNDPEYLESLGGTYTLAPQSNNVRDFFQVGHTIATSLGVSVNRDNTRAHFNYTNSNGRGIIPGNDLNSHYLNLRFSTDLIPDKLVIDAKANYIRDDFSNVLAAGEGFDNPLRYAYVLPRNIRTQDMERYEFVNAAGQTRQHFYNPNDNGTGNPYWTINNVLRPRIRERVLGIGFFKVPDHRRPVYSRTYRD